MRIKLFSIFKKAPRSVSSDGEILSIEDIEALIKRIGSEQAGKVIREKAVSGHKLCQSFLSTSAIHFVDNTKLSQAAKSKALPNSNVNSPSITSFSSIERDFYLIKLKPVDFLSLPFSWHF